MTSVTDKRVNPSWTPTPTMMAENPRLPRWVPGGHPMNPLGVRALYLGSSTYRIHGTDAPWTIGTAVSKGCIRMYNQDVQDLYPRATVGAKVTVTYNRFDGVATSSGSGGSGNQQRRRQLLQLLRQRRPAAGEAASAPDARQERLIAISCARLTGRETEGGPSGRPFAWWRMVQSRSQRSSTRVEGEPEQCHFACMTNKTSPAGWVVQVTVPAPILPTKGGWHPMDRRRRVVRAIVRVLQRGDCGCRQRHRGDDEACGQGRGQGWRDVRRQGTLRGRDSRAEPQGRRGEAGVS